MRRIERESLATLLCELADRLSSYPAEVEVRAKAMTAEMNDVMAREYAAQIYTAHSLAMELSGAAQSIRSLVDSYLRRKSKLATNR